MAALGGGIFSAPPPRRPTVGPASYDVLWLPKLPFGAFWWLLVTQKKHQKGFGAFWVTKTHQTPFGDR